MGILGHVWDIATAALPMGGTINKLGRMAGNALYENRHKIAGLAGKALGELGRQYIPEGVRHLAGKAADAALEALPDSKVKSTLRSINEGAQGRSNQYKKSDVTINPAADVYNSSTIKRERANDSLHHHRPPEIGSTHASDYQGGAKPVTYTSLHTQPSQYSTTRRRRHRKH
jgi:hypothetical protein